MDDGPRQGAVVERDDFLKQRETYCRLRGWDSLTGNPHRGQAVRVGPGLDPGGKEPEGLKLRPWCIG